MTTKEKKMSMDHFKKAYEVFICSLMEKQQGSPINNYF